MKKLFFSLLAGLSIVVAASAFSTKTIEAPKSAEPVLTILATKDNCTSTSTCPNGNTISCTAETCAPCDAIIINALKGGFCSGGTEQD